MFHDKLEKAFLIIDNHRKNSCVSLLKQMEKIRIEGISAAAVKYSVLYENVKLCEEKTLQN